MSAEPEAVEVATSLPAVRERGAVLLTPVMDVHTAMKRLQEFQTFCASYLKEGIDEDYGTIPGTKKKTLLKPGADKLAEIYGLADDYKIETDVEDWDKGLFDYKVKCILTSRRDDSLVGTGLGSCSSYESKYRWRDAQKKCPVCGSEAIIKGKAEYGGGWTCWAKKSGCGAKFKDGDASIEKQVTGRVENPDIIDAKNTVLKMAKKRAKIDAIIGVTRSSGIFTQDMEEVAATAVVEPVAVTTEPYTRTAQLKPVTPSDVKKALVSAAGGNPDEVYEPVRVAVTTEPYTRQSTLNQVTPSDVKDALLRVGGHDTDSRPLPTATGVATPSPESVPTGEEYITTPQRRELHATFRKAVPEERKNDADTYFYDWLIKAGYEKNGEPSTGLIPASQLADVKKKLNSYAKSL